MRPATTAELDRLHASRYNVALRVDIRDAVGTWVRLDTLGGIDWIQGATWTADIDQPVMDGRVMLHQRRGTDSLVPLVEQSGYNRDAGNNYVPLINAGRRIRIYTSVVDPGGSFEASWKLMLEGKIDNVSWPGSLIELSFRDLGALLQVEIETVKEYGSATVGTPVEEIIQEILDDNNTGVTLYTPVSPGWMIYKFEIDPTNVLEAIRNLALQIGWDVRYLFDSADVFRLTLFEPERDVNRVADAPLGVDATPVDGTSDGWLVSTGSGITAVRTVASGYQQINVTGSTAVGVAQIYRVIPAREGQYALARAEVQVVSKTGTAKADIIIAARDAGGAWLGNVAVSESAVSAFSKMETALLRAPAGTVDFALVLRDNIQVSGELINARFKNAELRVVENIFDADDYKEVTAIDISDSDVRNVIRVNFLDLNDEADFATAQDNDSISEYGRRYAEIGEDAASNIDTIVEAQRLADAVLSDLSTPGAIQETNNLYFWPVQVGDFLRWLPNGVHYDAAQDFAVWGYTHEFSNGTGYTRLLTGGKPAGAYASWLRDFAGRERGVDMGIRDVSMVWDELNKVMRLRATGIRTGSVEFHVSDDPTFASVVFSDHFTLLNEQTIEHLEPIATFERGVVYYFVAVPRGGPLDVGGLATGAVGVAGGDSEIIPPITGEELKPVFHISYNQNPSTQTHQHFRIWVSGWVREAEPLDVRWRVVNERGGIVFDWVPWEEMTSLGGLEWMKDLAVARPPALWRYRLEVEVKDAATRTGERDADITPAEEWRDPDDGLIKKGYPVIEGNKYIEDEEGAQLKADTAEADANAETTARGLGSDQEFIGKLKGKPAVIVAEQASAGAQGASLIKNPTFADWPIGNSYPTGWGGAFGSVLPTRETTITRTGGTAARYNCPGGVDRYFRADLGFGGVVLPSDAVEYVVVEVDIWKVSGDHTSSGLLIRWVDSGNRDTNIDFGTELPTMDAGRWYTVRKTIRRSTAFVGPAVDFDVFVMASWTSLGTRPAVDIVYDRLFVREATLEEIKAFLALEADGGVIREKALKNVPSHDVTTGKVKKSISFHEGTSPEDTTGSQSKADIAESDANAETTARGLGSGKILDPTVMVNSKAMSAVKLASDKADAGLETTGVVKLNVPRAFAAANLPSIDGGTGKVLKNISFSGSAELPEGQDGAQAKANVAESDAIAETTARGLGADQEFTGKIGGTLATSVKLQAEASAQNLLGAGAGTEATWPNTERTIAQVTLAASGLNVGDAVSASVDLKNAHDADGRFISLRFYDSTPALISSIPGNTITGMTYGRSVRSSVIPANTNLIELYIDNASTINVASFTVKRAMLNRGPIPLAFEEPPFRTARETAAQLPAGNLPSVIKRFDGGNLESEIGAQGKADVAEADSIAEATTRGLGATGFSGRVKDSALIERSGGGSTVRADAAIHEAETSFDNIAKSPDNVIVNGGGQNGTVGASAGAPWNTGNAKISDSWGIDGGRSLIISNPALNDQNDYQAIAVVAGDIWEGFGWINADALVDGTGLGAFVYISHQSGANSIEVLEAAPIIYGTTGIRQDVGVGILAAESPALKFVRVLIKIRTTGNIWYYIGVGLTGTIQGSARFDGLTFRMIQPGLARQYSALDGSGNIKDGVTQGGKVIAKGHQEGQARWDGTAGGTAVNFPALFDNPPMVLLSGGVCYAPSGAGWNAFDATKRQYMRRIANEIDADGFKLLAQLYQKTTAITRRTKNLTYTLDAVAESIESGLLNTFSGPPTTPAYDGQYGFRFKVSCTSGSDAMKPWIPYHANITIVLETYEGTGWTIRSTRSYSRNGQEEGSGTSTWNEDILITDFGLDTITTDKLRIRVTALDLAGGGAAASVTNQSLGDEFYFNTQAGTENTTSMTPDTDDMIRWEAIEV